MLARSCQQRCFLLCVRERERDVYVFCVSDKALAAAAARVECHNPRALLIHTSGSMPRKQRSGVRRIGMPAPPSAPIPARAQAIGWAIGTAGRVGTPDHCATPDT